jgi:hypothetical protein
MSKIDMTTEKTKQDVSDVKKKLKLPANVGTLPPGDDPFKDYLIDDWHFLEEVGGRSSCPKCNKSRKYFCYTCYVPVIELTGKIPYVKVRLINFPVAMCNLIIIHNAYCTYNVILYCMTVAMYVHVPSPKSPCVMCWYKMKMHS